MPHSTADRPAAPARSWRASLESLLLGIWHRLNSPSGRGTIKCTLAYTIASLATFVPTFARFLGEPGGKHVVATITVYFHPARSAGSMIEAVMIAVCAILYAEIISVLSMATSVLVGSVWGLVALAHVLVVVVFIFGGFGFIGWMKQHMNNPLVNVGGTLSSLAIISVVTKESAVVSNVFSNQKIVQVLKILVLGVTTTTGVNLLVWRVSARSALWQSMNKVSMSLGDRLYMISKSYLGGYETDLSSPDLAAATSAYAAGYTALMRNLREAKFEHYLAGHHEVYALERSIAISMETLAQSIGGLTSAASTQFSLLKEKTYHHPPARLSQGRVDAYVTPIPSRPSTARTQHPAASDSNESGPVYFQNEQAEDSAEAPIVNPSDISEIFVALLRPTLSTLAFLLAKLLREPPFGAAPEYEIALNDDFRNALTDALISFNVARAQAMQEIYEAIEQSKVSAQDGAHTDFEEVAAACGHFSFSLQSFGEEMVKYLDVMDDLQHASRNRRRNWNWLFWWRKSNKDQQQAALLPFESAEAESLIKPLRKSAVPVGIPDFMRERRDTYGWQAAPEAEGIIGKISRMALKTARKVARDDIRFGLKVGFGAALWAMLAFFPETRDVYNHYRGEWGLLSFMIVCSMTVGASNTTGWSRFIGTLIGAACSFINWKLSQGNAVGLVILGACVSFWNFYLIVAMGKAPLGRMTLLAYNVSTLYAYSVSAGLDGPRSPDDDEGVRTPNIAEIVKHRTISVTAGILWGLIICRVIWPISARRKFKQGVSMLHLQMGLIWRRGPLAILLHSDCSQSYLRSGEQQALRRYANHLESLRASAASEFELRGPFPFAACGRIMRSTDRILDSFHAMSLVAQRRGSLTPGEKVLLRSTAQERAILCDRTCHVFQVLASQMMLEYPLTNAVPNIMSTRERLLTKVSQLRKENQLRLSQRSTAESHPSTPQGGSGDSQSEVVGHEPPVIVEEKDYALLYAYALVTGQVADELSQIQKELEGLFGVIDERSRLLQ